MNDISLAKFLGCFSIALGAVELIAPRSLIRLLGLPRSAALVRASLDDDGRGHGRGGWFGDSRGHSEAARRRYRD